MADPPVADPWKGSQGNVTDDLWRNAVTELEKRMVESLRALRELFDNKLEDRDKALTLQAAKDKDHFEALNGEAGRLKAMQATYVMDAVFSTFVKGYDEWKRTTDLAINSLSGIVDRIGRVDERTANVEKSIAGMGGFSSKIDINTTRVTSVEQKLASYDGIYEKIERNTNQLGMVERAAAERMVAHEKFSSERHASLDKSVEERLQKLDNQMSNWMGRVIGFSVAVSLVVTVLGLLLKFIIK